MTVEVKDARFCKDCCTVTDSKECPHCGDNTRLHPERREKDGYSCECAGPFSREELLVRTFEDDPYSQVDDGMLITVCRKCEAFEQARNTDDDSVYDFVSEFNMQVACPKCRELLTSEDMDEDREWYYCPDCKSVLKPTPF